MAVLLGSCTKDSGPVIIRPETDTVSFNDTIIPILVTNCVSGCHPGFGALDLTATNAYTDLVNVASINYPPGLRVSPQDPEGSVFYQKIVGNTQYGSVMPPAPPPLTDEETGLIYDWIKQGALDN